MPVEPARRKTEKYLRKQRAARSAETKACSIAVHYSLCRYASTEGVQKLEPSQHKACWKTTFLFQKRKDFVCWLESIYHKPPPLEFQLHGWVPGLEAFGLLGRDCPWHPGLSPVPEVSGCLAGGNSSSATVVLFEFHWVCLFVEGAYSCGVGLKRNQKGNHHFGADPQKKTRPFDEERAPYSCVLRCPWPATSATCDGRAPLSSTSALAGATFRRTCSPASCPLANDWQSLVELQSSNISVSSSLEQR